MTILARPMFNMPRRMASGGGASFPDLSGDGQVTRKDILMGRGVVQKANGGGIASMMDPAMMGMAPPPMDPMMAQDLNAMENQGMALGQDLVVNAEMGIDAAENPQQVIDALRGNQLPLQARYDELATFVGPEDAAITPTSVLALTQPAIIMASEGEVDQGVGGLMQGMTGDVMMENEMGMGVGELMAGPAPQPVPMNKGGAVPKLQRGSTDQETAPGRFNLESETGKTFDELQRMAGITENEKKLQDLAIYSSLFDRAVGLVTNKDPRTGENLDGNTLGNIAQVAGGFLGDVAKAKAPELTRNAQLRDFSLQDTLARRTMQEKAGYDLQAAEVAAGLRGVNTNQLRDAIRDPDLLQRYAAGQTTSQETADIDLAFASLFPPSPTQVGVGPSGEFVTQMVSSLPEAYKRIQQQRAQTLALQKDPTVQTPDDTGDLTGIVGAGGSPEEIAELQATEETQREEVDQIIADLGIDSIQSEATDAVADLFSGIPIFALKTIFDPAATALSLEPGPQRVQRERATELLKNINTNIVTARLAQPGIKDTTTVRATYMDLLPDPNQGSAFNSVASALSKYEQAIGLLSEQRKETQNDITRGEYLNDLAGLRDARNYISLMDTQILTVANVVNALRKDIGISSTSSSSYRKIPRGSNNGR